MQPGDFIRQLEQGVIAPVYLFSGEVELLIEEAWGRLLEKIVPAKAGHFNGEKLSARECTIEDVLTRVSTLPMFGPKRLLMVQHVEAWSKEQRNTLLAYVARPHPTSCLVLAAAQRKGLEKLEAAVESVGMVVRFPAPSERDAPHWIQERARNHQKTISVQAASFLIEQVGLDWHLLERELEKLSAYVGARERIELEDVRQAVSAHRSFSVFELLRYVSLHQSSQAVISLRQLMLSGEPPLTVLALLIRQVRILWQVKDGLERGRSLSQIGQQLGLPPFVVKNYAQQTTQFSEADLLRVHQALRETDLALKSTGSAPEVILEALVLRLCQK